MVLSKLLFNVTVCFVLIVILESNFHFSSGNFLFIYSLTFYIYFLFGLLPMEHESQVEFLRLTISFIFILQLYTLYNFLPLIDWVSPGCWFPSPRALVLPYPGAPLASTLPLTLMPVYRTAVALSNSLLRVPLTLSPSLMPAVML